MEKNVEQKSKEKVQKIQAKKKLGQKLLQTLTKNRYKIQNNNARASGARPKNGAARSARRPIFGVVVLNFVLVFCRNLLELLAELLAKFFLGLDFFDIFLRHFFRHVLRSKNCQNRQKYFWPNRFLDKKHMGQKIKKYQRGLSGGIF